MHGHLIKAREAIEKCLVCPRCGKPFHDIKREFIDNWVRIYYLHRNAKPCMIIKEAEEWDYE